MLDADAARDVLDDALSSVAKAHEGYAALEGGHRLRAVAHRGILGEHTQTSELRVRVRVGVPNKKIGGIAYGECVTSDLTKAALKDAVSDATALAKALPPDPDALRVLADGEGPDAPSIDAVDGDLLDTGPGFRLHRIVDHALELSRWGLAGSGWYEATMGGFEQGEPAPFALATNRKVFRFSLHTHNQVAVRLEHADKSPAWAAHLVAEGPRRGDTDLDTVDRELTNLIGHLLTTDERMIASTLTHRSDDLAASGELDLLLEQTAVATLLDVLARALSGQAVASGDSPWSANRLGTQPLPEWFSLRADPTDRRAYRSPFDIDGVGLSPHHLVVDGVITALAQSRRSAAALSAEANGHGRTLRGASDPRALIIDGEDATSSVVDLLPGVDQGLVLGRVEVTRIDAWKLTLFAPDGALRVDAAAVIGTTPPLVIELDLLELFAAVDARTSSRLTLGAVVPAMRARRVAYRNLQVFGGNA